MESDRLIRALLGAALFLFATFLFEPSLFGASLPAGLMAAEMFRNIVGVAGAICGIWLAFDALVPKPKPRPSRAYPAMKPEPEPAPVSEPPAPPRSDTD